MQLATEHYFNLKKENYRVCELIQKEVDRRIDSKEIDMNMMQAFRYYNPQTQRFEGEYKFKGMNGLFKKLNLKNSNND